MIKNYITSALRNLLGNKSYTVINIIGLTTGLVASILLGLYVFDELNYDQFYKDSGNYYRIYTSMKFNGTEDINGKVAPPLAQEIKSRFPEAGDVCRLGYFGNQFLTYNETTFREWEIYGVDKNYFDFAPIELIEGDPKTALENPSSVVISESVAKKYFGNEDPMGKIIQSKNWGAYIVTGVFNEYPANSHFSCKFLVSIDTYPESRVIDWLDHSYYTYLKLSESTDPVEFENKLQSIVNGPIASVVTKRLGFSLETLIKQGNEFRLKLQPVEDIHLYSAKEYGIDINSEWGSIKIGDIVYVYIFGIVAIFILGLAIINYTNLATARAERRAKEIGIRKTLGTKRYNLIFQFLSESTITVLVAILFALVAVEFILPFFNSFTHKTLSIDYIESVYTIPFILLFAVIVGVLSGSYPAFYLSSVNPVQILKNGGLSRKSKLHSSLVILQFTISIALAVSAVFVREQLEYITGKDLGFNKEYLVEISNNHDITDKIKVFKQRILTNPNVLSATHCTRLFEPGIPGNGYLLDGSSDPNPILCQTVKTDYDFLNTFQIKLKEGRFFRKDFGSDSEAVVINKAAVNELGIENPVGKIIKQIRSDNKVIKLEIIGVIDDFNYESLHREIRPLAIQLGYPRQSNNRVLLRVSPNNLVATMEAIRNEWISATKVNSVNIHFVDESIQRVYESEKNAGIIIGIFTLIALLIACLGLFGLVIFFTEQKVKEIGIRKTLGASASQIVVLLSKQYLKLVLISNLIAWPLAYYFVAKWLENFAFRISIGVYPFIISAIVAVIFSLITVSTKTIRAALANPVESLRDE